MAKTLFLDTNIIIDFIEQRPFEKEEIIELFKLAERSEIEVCISESVITTTLYVTKNAAQLNRVLKIATVICIKAADIKIALTSDFSDKEDAILYYGAVHAEIDFFITRNEKDFIKNALPQLPVLSPKKFLKKLHQ
jgi:predicted nucleic acid-binding protein